MDLSIEGVFDVGDFHRRCAAHDRWLQANPDVAAFGEQWAGALDALPVVDCTRIIREVDHLHLGFLVHGRCPSFVVREGVVDELALLR
jgi:hypothetical protein